MVVPSIVYIVFSKVMNVDMYMYVLIAIYCMHTCASNAP